MTTKTVNESIRKFKNCSNCLGIAGRIMTMIKFSIITICLNIEAEIGNTIASVINQSCTDYEYLIKDGVSSDGTVGVAESFAQAFAEKGISYRIISQSDSGIYDAMNQAVREAQGEWVIFMNAGDCFANSSVLDRVNKSGCLKDADIVYGDRILRNKKLFRYQNAYALEDIRYKMPFCHQSALTKRELLQNNPYSLQYRICSDHRFYLQMYLEKKKFVYFPEAVSIYDVNGLSSNFEMTLKDVIRILEDMPIRDEEAIQKVKNDLEFRRKNENQEMRTHPHLRRLIPEVLRKKRWEFKDRKAGWKTEKELFGKKKDKP